MKVRSYTRLSWNILLFCLNYLYVWCEFRGFFTITATKTIYCVTKFIITNRNICYWYLVPSHSCKCVCVWATSKSTLQLHGLPYRRLEKYTHPTRIIYIWNARQQSQPQPQPQPHSYISIRQMRAILMSQKLRYLHYTYILLLNYTYVYRVHMYCHFKTNAYDNCCRLTLLDLMISNHYILQIEWMNEMECVSLFS